MHETDISRKDMSRVVGLSLLCLLRYSTPLPYTDEVFLIIKVYRVIINKIVRVNRVSNLREN